MKKGEITAFLSLLFLLLVSFVGSLAESASIQVSKNYRRADMDMAMQSVFAEYQRDLLKQYDIFALEATYETGGFSYENVLRRLDYYGAKPGEQVLEGVQLLTDDGGAPFYNQAVFYMKEKYGISYLEELIGVTGRWEQQEKQAEICEEEAKQVSEEMDSALEESGTSLPEEQNPLACAANLKNSNLLELVRPQGETVSEKTIDHADCPSGRTLREGNGHPAVPEETVAGRLLFGEYLLTHFHCAVEPQEEGALAYEIEYLIAGKESDAGNLESVVTRLLAIRFASNYGYLLLDAGKQSEAEVVAVALLALAGQPELAEVAKQAILLAWAFGESIVDVRMLLAGHKVPLVKTEETWQLPLSGLFTLGTAGNTGEGSGSEDGLSYQEYLRMLLFLAKNEDTAMRALDLIEQNLRVAKECSWFRADQSIVWMEVLSTCSLRRGVTYSFRTGYGYRQM